MNDIKDSEDLYEEYESLESNLIRYKTMLSLILNEGKFTRDQLYYGIKELIAFGVFDISDGELDGCNKKGLERLLTIRLENFSHDDDFDTIQNIVLQLGLIYGSIAELSNKIDKEAKWKNDNW